jgi:6-phosphogluconolactonase
MQTLKLTLAILAGAAIFGTAQANEAGAVYTMTNEASGNRLVVLPRDGQGTLGTPRFVSTGGLGSGNGIGSQNAVTLSRDGNRLFVVNAGSNDVSVFALNGQGPALIGRYASGGARPISVTEANGSVYVLNAGGSGNVSGFVALPNGSLEPIVGTLRALSGGATAPAQVQFSPDGTRLVVTEKATNLIDSYVVLPGGALGDLTSTPAPGVTPFGFDFDNKGRLFVSEAFGGAPGASALSSFALSGGSWQVVSASSPTHQTAACWTIVAKNGKFVYTTNAGSGSITGYRIAGDGSVSLLNAGGFTASTGVDSHPTDLALSISGKYLYAISPATGTLAQFRVGSDGSLTGAGIVSGLPTSITGLAGK